MPVTEPPLIATLVRETQQRQRPTQEQLAQEIEVSYQSVNRWETDTRLPVPLAPRVFPDKAGHPQPLHCCERKDSCVVSGCPALSRNIEALKQIQQLLRQGGERDQDLLVKNFADEV